MKLNTKELNVLRSRFDELPDGLPRRICKHHARMCSHGQRGMPENEVIAELTELFRQVDVNGDGTMSGGVYGFCIEQGMAATQHDAVVLMNYTLKTSRYGHDNMYSKEVERLWFPLLNKLFACEAGNPRMKVYCPSRGQTVRPPP